MPPKTKFTRDDIINAAFEIARQEGFDSVVARNVGKKLGSTVSPIFTAFENMEELKKEVYYLAKKRCSDYLCECVKYTPAFKEFGIRWVQLAFNEPNLYRLVFLGEGEALNSVDSIQAWFTDIIDMLVKESMQTFDISQEDALRLISQMIIHANGIAVFGMKHVASFDMAQTGRLLSEACIGLVIMYKTAAGTYNPELASHMASAIANIPKQIKK
ncbi:MAG: TetR/AcrR family transcriptional regulator [Acutalibacteraceae bacterium]